MDIELPEDLKIKRIITCTVEGILEEDDLLALARGDKGQEALQSSEPAVREVDDPTDLKRVREKHHSVARLLASGMSQTLVATLSGYTDSYLSILLNNPAMQELVAHYRTIQGNASTVIAEKLRTVGMTALDKIAARLEDDGENAMDDHALIGVAKLGLDRAGHGPSSTSKNVTEHHVVDHAEIARLNMEARRGSKEYIVPVHQVRQAALPSPNKEDDT